MFIDGDRKRPTTCRLRNGRSRQPSYDTIECWRPDILAANVIFVDDARLVIGSFPKDPQPIEKDLESQASLDI